MCTAYRLELMKMQQSKNLTVCMWSKYSMWSQHISLDKIATRSTLRHEFIVPFIEVM